MSHYEEYLGFYHQGEHLEGDPATKNRYVTSERFGAGLCSDPSGSGHGWRDSAGGGERQLQ